MFRRLSTRLVLANLVVLGIGGVAFAVTFRLLAPEIFNRRLGRGAGGPGGPSGNQGLLETFTNSVDVALVVSLAVGVVAAGIVAWFVAERMGRSLVKVGGATRSMTAGHYDARVPPSGVVEIDEVIADVNTLAEQLQETEARRSRLLSDVTHELRTPLASIDGFVEGAADGVFTPEETHRAVKEETSRLLRLIEDLSVLSKTSEHVLGISTQRTALVEMVSETVDDLRPRFSDAEVSIRVEADGAPEVDVDRDRMRQVLVNLLTNAIGHTEPGGSVVVTVGMSPESAVVAVTDDGDGITEKDLPRVFDRFFRGSSRTRREGTGLGLAVAKGIVEAHGGILSAHSEGAGTGATFTVALPVTSER